MPQSAENPQLPIIRNNQQCWKLLAGNLGGQRPERCRKSENLKLGLDSDANYWKITIHSLTEGSEKDQNRVGFSFSIVKLFRTLLELFGRTDQPELTLFIVGGRI